MSSIQFQPTVEIFASVHEHDVDYLLLEEFITSSQFRNWFLNQTVMKSDLILTKAEHSYRHRSKSIKAKSNETDIMLEFYDEATSQYLTFFIEDKLDHILNTKQAESYQERMESYVEDYPEKNITAYSVLIAPTQDEYWLKKDKFDFAISFECLLEYFAKAKDVNFRYSYKHILLVAAVKKSRRTRPDKQSVDKAVQFRSKYCGIFSRIAPELNCQPLDDASSQSLFINFQTDELKLRHMILRHKARPCHSSVDLQLPSNIDIELAKTKYEHLLLRLGLPDGWATFEPTGKSVSISLPVPGIDVNDDFKKQEKNVIIIAQTAKKLYLWFLENA